ncbi:hypothetical protein AOQ84DRAFT_53593 [Glonium stellatum]|uniref:Uncharacterized protein n=1 Tax=Glonium stellatum TaxID=574774 RepID=A0A8E2JSP3_9PEZI|nr:hypothetical protein AOQ84DRAFT_53593 [Glonium stellatum]
MRREQVEERLTGKSCEGLQTRPPAKMVDYSCDTRNCDRRSVRSLQIDESDETPRCDSKGSKCGIPQSFAADSNRNQNTPLHTTRLWPGLFLRLKLRVQQNSSHSEAAKRQILKRGGTPIKLPASAASRKQGDGGASCQTILPNASVVTMEMRASGMCDGIYWFPRAHQLPSSPCAE